MGKPRLYHQAALAALIAITTTFLTKSLFAAEPTILNTEIDKASYAIGLKYGQALKKDLSELNLPVFQRGLTDAFHEKEPLLDTLEINQVLTTFQQTKRVAAQKIHEEKAQKNITTGKDFLANNAKKDGVKVTKSGLQYKILKAGKGSSPSSDDTVTVHYEGTLIDGSVFDSSRQRGQPIQFPVNGVIPGWTEALQLMKPGSHWQLFIPSDLAYGKNGTSGAIGPNETLIFDVELISFDQKQAPKTHEDKAHSPH